MLPFDVGETITCMLEQYLEPKKSLTYKENLKSIFLFRSFLMDLFSQPFFLSLWMTQ